MPAFKIQAARRLIARGALSILDVVAARLKSYGLEPEVSDNRIICDPNEDVIAKVMAELRATKTRGPSGSLSNYYKLSLFGKRVAIDTRRTRSGMVITFNDQ